MVTVLDHLTPDDLGLPPKFSKSGFRQIQREMTQFALVPGPGQRKTQFVGIGAAPGAGKSLVAHMIGAMSGGKYAVLTATRSLEDQQAADGFNVVNVRGKSNYQCVEFNPEEPDRRWSCEQGYEEEGCKCAGSNLCTYRQQVQLATESEDGILSNYQFWMNVRAMNQHALETPDAPVQTLVCDEGHLLMNELARFLNCHVANESLHRWTEQAVREVLRQAGGAEWGRINLVWTAMLELAQKNIAERMGKILDTYDGVEALARKHSTEYRGLDKLTGKLGKVVQHGNDVTSAGSNWIWRQTKGGISFECVWPGRYASRYLWSGVPNIVIMSATLRPKALELVGVPASNYRFKEWPRVFKAELSPVWWVPTGKVGIKASEQDKEASFRRADQIYEEWGHLRGLVYVPSYDLAERIKSRSRFGRYMILNKPGEDAAAVADRYRRTPPPAILVSPSYGTGHDFADEACEWVHIFKLPYADRGDAVVKARCESDPGWYDYKTMQDLVQICGRGSRHERDRCTYIITDDSIGRFRNYARSSAPAWFSVKEWKGPGEIPRAPARTQTSATG